MVTEIRSALWQKILASIIFAIIGAGFPLAVLYVLCPNLCSPGGGPPGTLGSIPGGGIENTQHILIATFIAFAVGFYVWWSTIRYRIYYDSEGIGQTNGFIRSYVKWGQVSSYRMKQIGSYRQSLVEPALYNAGAREIFRPIMPIFILSSQAEDDRAEFWQHVISKLDAQIKRT